MNLDKKRYIAPKVEDHRPIVFETSISGALSGHWEFRETSPDCWEVVWVYD